MRGNTVSIKGNITRDAELRQTQSGNIIASWGLAWKQPRKNKQGGYDDVPHYFDVKCWLTDRQAEFVTPLLVKGAPCAVVGGHLVFEQWEVEGQKRSKVSVMCDDPVNGLIVGQPRKQQAPQPAYQQPYQQQPQQAHQQPDYQQQAYQQPAYRQSVQQAIMYDEDIPF